MAKPLPLTSEYLENMKKTKEKEESDKLQLLRLESLKLALNTLNPSYFIDLCRAQDAVLTTADRYLEYILKTNKNQ